jgi:hypothetical protein
VSIETGVDRMNVFQRNMDSLKAQLVEQQKHNELFGSADPRIARVLTYLAGDFNHPKWPHAMRMAMIVSNERDFNDYVANPLAMAVLTVAEGGKPSREILSSIRNRLTRCS